MTSYFLYPKAELDLEEIWFYIAEDNVQNARKFIDKIEEKFQLLSEFPYMGVEWKYYRMYPVGDYNIIYQPVDYGVEIVRVLHSAQNVGSA